MSWVLYVSIVGAAVVAVSAVVHVRRSTWTGFTGRTLWDWLQLLVIPLALAVGAFALNQLQSDREHRREERRATLDRSRAIERAREEFLRTYLQQMAQLMLDRKLLRSHTRSDVRVVARTTTLTALRQLDGQRKGLVVRFLSEARLINGSDPKIVLRDADLRNVVLQDAVLPRIRLESTTLTHANFRGADLRRAKFTTADLRGADLSGARALFFRGRSVYFQGADLAHTRFTNVVFVAPDFRFAGLARASLRGAQLNGADFTGACLTHADFGHAGLEGAKLNAEGRRVNFQGASLGGTAFTRDWRRTGHTFSRVGSPSGIVLPPALFSAVERECK